MTERREIFNPDFDETEGLTESPDVAQARTALAEAQTGMIATEDAIAESQSWVTGLRTIRDENHFTQKIRLIIQSARSAHV